jgi:hypothetical protein
VPFNYDDIKGSLSPDQRAYLEGAKKPRKAPKPVVPTVQFTGGTSEPSQGWMNCENGCMGRTNGPPECDMCGGRMIPGPSSGPSSGPPGQLKKN